MTALVLTRDVSPAECPWLDVPFNKGSVVYLYSDHTYGCVSPTGIACTKADGKLPFFELPADALERKP